MQFAFYVRQENKSSLMERFTLFNLCNVDFEDAVELKKSYNRCMSLLGHPGKIRVVPFTSSEEPPTEFHHEDELNEIYKRNESQIPAPI